LFGFHNWLPFKFIFKKEENLLLLFFSLDRKEAKDQGGQKLSKNIFVSLKRNNLVFRENEISFLNTSLKDFLYANF